ncbi:MAG: hypothetical protein ACTHN0_17210 [Aquihabitans sp.]
MTTSVSDGSTRAVDEGPSIHLEYCGEWTTIPAPGPFTMGREADLSIDDNPYLHRTFLELRWDRYWWLNNIGSRLTATISDDQGAMQAWLAPGAALPLVFGTIEIRFTAGPTSYLVALNQEDAAVTLVGAGVSAVGATTLRPAELTLNQRLTVLSLAEPALRAAHGERTTLPSSQQAAARLGWTITKFNRQLDAVCQKLARTGVRGLHGGVDQLASGRRSRLVEYAVAMRVVTAEDLPLLDLPQEP